MYRLVTLLCDPYVLVLGLLAVSVLRAWRRRPVTRWTMAPVVVAAGGLTLISLPLTAYLACGTLEWGHPPLKERPPDIGAIIVLGGGIAPADDVRPRAELADDSLRRCAMAVQWYHQGPPCLVVASGGTLQGPDAPGPTIAGAMQAYLRSHGLPATQVLVEEESTSTYENALHVARLLRERQIDRVLLVSDAIHLRRANRCFRKQGIETITTGSRYRATTPPRFPEALIPNARSALAVSDVCHEWLGLLWYRLRGWC